jgi:hypothetical protein
MREHGPQSFMATEGCEQKRNTLPFCDKDSALPDDLGQIIESLADKMPQPHTIAAAPYRAQLQQGFGHCRLDARKTLQAAPPQALTSCATRVQSGSHSAVIGVSMSMVLDPTSLH